MPSLSPTAPRFFRQAFERLDTLLQPAVRTAPDGFLYLQPDVLPEAQRLYAELTSYGYANGWIQ